MRPKYTKNHWELESTFIWKYNVTWSTVEASNSKNCAISFAVEEEIPFITSIGTVFTFSGVFLATSSMSIPPAGEAIQTGPFWLLFYAFTYIKITKFSIRYFDIVQINLSRMKQRYFSSKMSTDSAIMTWLTGTPPGGVCFVINLFPNMALAMSAILLLLKMNEILLGITRDVHVNLISHSLRMWTPLLNL